MNSGRHDLNKLNVHYLFIKYCISSNKLPWGLFNLWVSWIVGSVLRGGGYSKGEGLINIFGIF